MNSSPPPAVSHFALRSDHSRFKFNGEGLQTTSSSEQEQVERSVASHFTLLGRVASIDPTSPTLEREKHVAFLRKGLFRLSESYECLDASRPWLCYWIIHSLRLLETSLTDQEEANVVNFLVRCQDPAGGFGGGPGQLPHLAPTYAAVNALCSIGSDQALRVIDRTGLAAFLRRMRDPETGGFKLEETGETDVRGAYCAASVAHLTKIIDEPMFRGTGDWVLSCQTYEGGFAGAPGMEAHGGYSFCAFAALVILGKERLCDLDGFVRWLVNRQMRFEGGFQGRTNKMVDGCYSFWQGGAFPLIHATLASQADAALDVGSWLFNREALQEYLLACCQHPNGGLIDKPGKHRDFYHTCYCLSGLSVAQNAPGGSVVVGDGWNRLPTTHPLYNVCFPGVKKSLDFFDRQTLNDEAGDN